MDVCGHGLGHNVYHAAMCVLVNMFDLREVVSMRAKARSHIETE